MRGLEVEQGVSQRLRVLQGNQIFGCNLCASCCVPFGVVQRRRVGRRPFSADLQMRMQDVDLEYRLSR